MLTRIIDNNIPKSILLTKNFVSFSLNEYLRLLCSNYKNSLKYILTIIFLSIHMLFPLEYATVRIITLKVSYVTSIYPANCCQASNCFYFSQNTPSCVKHITLSHHPTKEKQQIDYTIGPTAIHDVVMYAINYILST